MRLKGGDPFVFGRGGEEALALVRARIPFEIVPGVSSLAAVITAAGVSRERPPPTSASAISRSLCIAM